MNKKEIMHVKIKIKEKKTNSDLAPSKVLLLFPGHHSLVEINLWAEDSSLVEAFEKQTHWSISIVKKKKGFNNCSLKHFKVFSNLLAMININCNFLFIFWEIYFLHFTHIWNYVLCLISISNLLTSF